VSVAGRPPVQFCVDLDVHDEVVPWLLDHDWIDEPVQRAFLDFVTPGARVLDLGSHLGVFSLPAAALGAEVIAVDAAAGHVRQLSQAAKRNGFDGLHAVHGAVADADGPVRFVESSIHGHLWSADEEDRNHIAVPSVRVDDLLREHGWDALNVVKMDIEGSECAALAGMKGLFASGCRPVIVFESNAVMLRLYRRSPTDLRSAFADLGYTLFHIDHLDPGALVASAPDAIQSEPATDFLALPPGVRPPRRWRVMPARTREQVVMRLVDQASSPHAGSRQYAASVLLNGPAWLGDHRASAIALTTLGLDEDEDVRSAATRPGDDLGFAGAAEPAAGVPVDVRVYAADLALAAPSSAPDRPPGQRELAAVHDVAVHVRSGQMLGVVGDPDAGSLLVDALAGLAAPLAGELSLNGRMVALNGLEHGLEPELSVAENIVIFGAYVGCDAAAVSAQIDQIARVARVWDVLDRPLADAPPGSAARLAIVIALEHAQPELLLVSGLEPFPGGSFATWCAERVEGLLHSGMAIVQAAPSAAQLLHPPTRLLLLRDGRAAACGHPASVEAMAP
jgi:FkbM family methyltransferase